DAIRRILCPVDADLSAVDEGGIVRRRQEADSFASRIGAADRHCGDVQEGLDLQPVEFQLDVYRVEVNVGLALLEDVRIRWIRPEAPALTIWPDSSTVCPSTLILNGTGE